LTLAIDGKYRIDGAEVSQEIAEKIYGKEAVDSLRKSDV
jgi:hypothetical protein